MRFTVSPPVARIVAAVVAFALGVYGFSDAYQLNYGHPGSLAGNAYKALQMISGRFPDDLDDHPLPWSLHIARWALPLLTFWTVLALAWVQVRNPVRLWWRARRGDHLVLGGTNALAEQIAASEHAARRTLILWNDDPTLGWVVRAGDRRQPSLATGDPAASAGRLGLDRARAVLFAGEDDTRNIALAGAAVAAAATRDKGDPLPIVVRVDDIDLRQAAEARFGGPAGGGARLRTISIPDIIARGLFLDRPLDRFVVVGRPTRTVFLLGFTPVIERYLLRMLAGAHFRSGERPQFIVIAPGAANLEAVFRARRPGADALAPVIFRDARVEEPSLMPAILDEAIGAHGDPCAIVVDGPDSARVLAVGYAIETWYRTGNRVAPPVHVRLDALADDQLGTTLFPFGGAATLGDVELLLQERHDVLARSVHDFYFEGRLTEGDIVGSRASMYEWEDLPESVRDDNRLVADCYQLKLRDIGARATTGTGAGLRLDETEVEDLARAEHDRWMAAKLIDGWVHGTTRDDATKRHPDIVPYDALSERIRELDREQIRLMTPLLPASGLIARRVLPVTLTKRDGASVGGVAVGDTLAMLTRDYPDRLPLIIGRLDDAATRQVLSAFLQIGALVAPVVTGNVDALLVTLSPDERQTAGRLTRAADTVFAVTADRADAWIAQAGTVSIGITGDGRCTPPSAVR